MEKLGEPSPALIPPISPPLRTAFRRSIHVADYWLPRSLECGTHIRNAAALQAPPGWAVLIAYSSFPIFFFFFHRVHLCYVCASDFDGVVGVGMGSPE
ncbi:hypothetical protein CEXT_53341 [Caerostris extrusa]|uniref:Uncharacterized protein n=1 Tax=Caerostris extrusa TaxID=172846 RepID=A0AAV4UQX6_CAEEX|nr:hypothetical protein CEXT_53341 [Caerostris extrusa]